jgi:hypothetical protein
MKESKRLRSNVSPVPSVRSIEIGKLDGAAEGKSLSWEVELKRRLLLLKRGHSASVDAVEVCNLVKLRVRAGERNCEESKF